MKQKNDAHEGTRSGVPDSLTVASDLAEPALGWSSLLAAGKGKVLRWRDHLYANSTYFAYREAHIIQALRHVRAGL